jgi:sec-independent protein translocase protein TatB
MTFAIIFDSVGAGEWLVLLAVLLVVMGPKRLPSTARTIGSYYSKFRRAADSFKRQLMDMDYEMEREIEKARREAEAAMSIPDEPPEFGEELGGADDEPGGDDANGDEPAKES